MRLELAGSLVQANPLVLRFDADDTFDTLAYIDLGYTHFDVICIGGGGGMGGGIDTLNTGTKVRSYGGAGGGGGFHRTRGLLSALPDECDVVVGAGGAPGTEHVSNPVLCHDGDDGGPSTFNVNTCRASGGEGGKKVQTNSISVSSEANGGEGGAGNRIVVGGGAAGGVAGIPTTLGPGTLGTNAADGTYLNNIGKGGGGGAGGIGTYGNDATCNAATAGGRGSYNPADTAVYSPGGTPSTDLSTDSINIIPGGAGGAKASPVNGLPTIFGRSNGATGVINLAGDDGVVIIRLTVE